MPADLTAILLPLPPRGPSPDFVVNLVAQHGASAAWVRLCPFDKLEIHQLEVLEGNTGLPAVSPALLVALSENGGKALFIHVNHQAKQVLLHAFEDGIEVKSYRGEPNEEFDQIFQELVGHTVDAIVAADDGTRLGFGQAASRTAAITRGRLLLVPTGTPTGLGTFAFHDRGHDRPSNLQITDAEDEDEKDTTRVAFFAFDGGLIQQAFGEVPGAQLAQVIGSAPVEVIGPLIELRDAVTAQLTELPTAPGQATDHPAWHTHAFELLALAHAGVYAGGDTAKFIDEKLLALLAIGDATPVVDADDAEELEAMPSVVDALIEVLPCPKPPGGYGPLLENLGPEEVGALVPWAKPNEPYDGTVFVIKTERLLPLVRGFDGNKLGQRLERFCRALYTARYGAVGSDEEYLKWRAGQEQKSHKDIERLLTAWAELRIVLELAAVNQLALGLLVYG
jgi:hypothetical protein